jgi:hypothetical protein
LTSTCCLLCDIHRLEQPNFEVAGTRSMVLSGIPILPQIPLIF